MEEDNQLSPQARQARDEIVDLLLQEQKVRAIQRYIQTSGKGLSEAKTVIDRLTQLLENPGLNAAEQAFLAGFYATLDKREPATPELPPLETLLEASTEDYHRVANEVVPPLNQPPKPRSATTRNRLWGVGGVLLAFTGLFFVGKNIFLASGQDEWVPVPAVVVQSYTSTSSKGSAGQTYYNSHFKYRYQVDGIQYIGDRYSFWSLGGEPSTGVERFRLGDRLTAYHHPLWHRYAVVERISPSFFTWMAGLLLLLIAAPSIWMAWTGQSSE